MTLVLSICLAVMAIVTAWGSKIVKEALKKLTEDNRGLWVEYEHVKAAVRGMQQLLHPGVAVDVGFKDRGWLILVCRVAGRDRVMIQNLKPEMTMSEYKRLVEKLSYDFEGVAYLDAPYGYESFLKKPGS